MNQITSAIFVYLSFTSSLCILAHSALPARDLPEAEIHMLTILKIAPEPVHIARNHPDLGKAYRFMLVYLPNNCQQYLNLAASKSTVTMQGVWTLVELHLVIIVFLAKLSYFLNTSQPRVHPFTLFLHN